MSHIIVCVEARANLSNVVARLRKVTQRSVSDIHTSLMNGTPIVDVELFDKDYEAHAFMLRGILACLHDMSLASKIYELPEGKNMETCEFTDRYEITPSVLKNILREADAEFNRQLENE